MGVNDSVININCDTKWIGSHFIGVFKNKTVLFYEKCSHGSLILSIGDFILVSNANSSDSNADFDWKVAKILNLYEQLEICGENTFWAFVRWFSRPSSIPYESFDSNNINVDFEKELIEDYRPYENNICLKRISGKCHVISGSLEETAECSLQFSVLSQTAPLFLCRYKYVKIKGSYCLVPFKFSNRKFVSNNKTHQKFSTLKDGSYNRKRRLPHRISTIGEHEFVDIGNLESNKVSPIKIIGGRSVVRLSEKASETSQIYKHKGNILCLQSNISCSNQNFLSDNILKYKNYSIVKPNEVSNEKKIKIKLRILDQSLSVDPLAVEKCSVNDESSTKTQKESEDETLEPPLIQRKSILKSTCKRQDGTSKRNIKLSDVIEKRIFNKSETLKQYQQSSTVKGEFLFCTESNDLVKSSQKKKPVRPLKMNPSVEKRKSVIDHMDCISNLEWEKQHNAAAHKSLPCREKEFYNIFSFLESKIQDNCSGCMYVSGVPGTGKTATVTNVIRLLQQKAAKLELKKFNFVEINGMRLSEPRQAYVEIYKQLTGKIVSWDFAHHMLEKRFSNQTQHRQSTVLLVDELDILCNKKQDVVYSLLDWPSKSAAQLIVITIANTMDLPERLLMGKVTSRLGLTRLSFLPYTHKQLKDIVISKLFTSETFKNDAVELVARKVAAVSGDARRALDICKRASELVDVVKIKNSNAHCSYVNMTHVQQAINEMIASIKVQFIKTISISQQIFLRAVMAEVLRTGIEETVFINVYCQIESMSQLLDIAIPTIGCALGICSSLSSQRLIICENARNDLFQKILLNVSIDDIHYALNINNI